jgi:hypothetical protein
VLNLRTFLAYVGELIDGMRDIGAGVVKPGGSFVAAVQAWHVLTVTPDLSSCRKPNTLHNRRGLVENERMWISVINC